jgi:methyl-accepting chemotaxis protein
MLMNKLSYAKKFGVISLTFFIPLLLLSYGIINQTYQSIQKTLVEQDSLSAIDSLLIVVDESAYYRDICSVQIIYSSNAELKGECDKLELNLYKSIKAISIKHSGEPVSATLESKLPSWKKKLDRVAENRQTVIQDQFNQYNKVVSELLFVASDTERASGLSLDSNENVQLLLKVLLTDYPAYKETIGFAHSVGVFAITQSFLAAGTFDVLNSVYDGMDASIASMNQSPKALL